MFPKTVIIRHKKENLKKCSLRGLEQREDLLFFTYPLKKMPELENYILLALDGPVLSPQDSASGLLLVDGTWRYAEKMLKTLPSSLPRRCLPANLRTAYPRKQTECPIPDQGLSSIEALYAAYRLLERDPSGLLDHYFWAASFLQKNPSLF